MIKIITDTSGFKALEEDWNSLYERSVLRTPFQSFSYNYLSWTEFMKEKGVLYIITVRRPNTNELEAIFPCLIERGVLLFINDRHTDFCTAIIDERIGRGDHRLYEEVAKYLQGDSRVKFVRFDNVMAEDMLLAGFKPFFKTQYCYEINAYSKLDIYQRDGDKTCFDAIRNVNAQRRKKLAAQLKRAGELQLSVSEKKGGDIYPEEAIINMVEAMIKEGTRERGYFSEPMLKEWKCLYEAGVLSVAILRQEEIVKSINFIIRDNLCKDYIKWLMLYIDKRYNLLLSLKLIEYLYEKGATINFARGIYDYKMVNFHPDVYNLYRLEIDKSTWTAVKGLAAMNWHYLKMIIKSIIRK